MWIFLQSFFVEKPPVWLAPVEQRPRQKLRVAAKLAITKLQISYRKDIAVL